MKKIILCVIFVLVAVCVRGQEITVFQINAKWNAKNTYDLSFVKNAKIKYGWLSDQSSDIKNSISAVPVIAIIDKNGKTRMQYVADLSFKIQATENEIQEIINKLNTPIRRATSN